MYAYLALRALLSIGLSTVELLGPILEQLVSFTEIFAGNIFVVRGLAGKAPCQMAQFTVLQKKNVYTLLQKLNREGE